MGQLNNSWRDKVKHKKGSCGNKSEVKIDEVAESLPVNVWFDRDQFSIETGIALKSCYQRLRTLVDKGYLEVKEETYRDLFYRMSLKNKLMMIEKAKLNIQNHGAGSDKNVKPVKKISAKELLKSEIEAHAEQADRILRTIKFI